METDTKTETPAEAMAALGLTVESVFVPWSQSRSKDDRETDHAGKPTKRPRYSLNWKVTLRRQMDADGHMINTILTTDYGAGIGHCPAYKASVKDIGGQNCIMRHDAIKGECETGVPWNMSRFGEKRKPSIAPDQLDVVHSLVSDSDVLNYSTYEDWAQDLGFDPDSRKGEAIYRTCLELALKLRNGLGEDGLARLRNAFQDY